MPDTVCNAVNELHALPPTPRPKTRTRDNVPVTRIEGEAMSTIAIPLYSTGELNDCKAHQCGGCKELVVARQGAHWCWSCWGWFPVDLVDPKILRGEIPDEPSVKAKVECSNCGHVFDTGLSTDSLRMLVRYPLPEPSDMKVTG